jgi:hypothetical protein
LFNFFRYEQGIILQLLNLIIDIDRSLQSQSENINIIPKNQLKMALKLRKIYEINYKILLKLSIEHNIKVDILIILSLS